MLLEAMETVRGWVEGPGAVGIALFIAAYVLATIFLVPTWVFTIVAGAAFGVAWGLGLVIACAVSGATAAFLLARHGLRARLTHSIVKRPLLEAIDQALRDQGWPVVALLRLSPIPFGIQNYLFGLSGVRIAHFIPATAVGIVPVTTLYLFVGASGREALQGGSPAKWAMLAVGIVATVLASWIVGRAARARLPKAIGGSSGASV